MFSLCPATEASHQCCLPRKHLHALQVSTRITDCCQVVHRVDPGHAFKAVWQQGGGCEEQTCYRIPIDIYIYLYI